MVELQSRFCHQQEREVNAAYSKEDFVMTVTWTLNRSKNYLMRDSKVLCFALKIVESLRRQA